MSMLSAQCDDLRAWAKALDGEGMPNLSRELEDAANVIWRLRNQNLELHDKVDEQGEQIDHLRKLVRDMWRFIDDDDACSHCGHNAECFEQNGINVAYEGGCLMLDVVASRMRELGIEVDG